MKQKTRTGFIKTLIDLRKALKKDYWVCFLVEKKRVGYKTKYLLEQKIR